MPIKREFRPVPENLKRMRYGVTEDSRWYARFYGIHESLTRKMLRIGFQVEIDPKLKRNRKALAEMIRKTVEELHYAVPEHMQGQVFSSFGELFDTDWVRTRRLMRYGAHVSYER